MWFGGFPILLALMVPLVAIDGRAEKPATAVPSWDARGPRTLPRQGIACLDLSDDGRWLALGTIAPAGHPNAFLLDADGRIVRSASVGQRWLQQVAVDRDGKRLLALCTMPAGRAGDFPTVYVCEKEPLPIPPHMGEDGWTGNLYHYGDHSNHVGVNLQGFDRGGVAVYGDRVLWLTAGDDRPEAEVRFPRSADALTVSLAVTRQGQAVVGCAVPPGEGKTAEPNLFLLSPEAKKPLWSRPVLSATDSGEAPEKGLYGTPTLPDGTRQELPQKDLPVFGPLAVAVHSPDRLRLVAAADYPGRQRRIRSSATLREQNYGVRFVPARPIVTVHDDQGKLVRRFGPELFPHPLWVDLRFCSGGKYVLASPHHWTCRGLAGQTILPADDHADSLFLLEIATGKVRTVTFPDAVSDVTAAEDGPVVVGCWNGQVYILDDDHLIKGKLPAGIEVGGPSLVRSSRDGSRVVIASTAGEVRLLDRAGREKWKVRLDEVVKPALLPWVANARAMPLGPGVWQLPGGRVESDLGGQCVVEAPDGLILIEGHAGMSFDREWQAMKAVGLDPTRVKYVLATHEHGDHAPGAYLWRIATGARFVCSEEMAYTLQHHLPLGTGYGLHPPVPTDIKIKKDTELDLAGLKVRALRLPGHTAGSMGWFFTKGERKYISFGDLIMPDGPLGYSGSINFSGRDVLASLRKLRDLEPNFALPGHGPVGDTSRYFQAGIEVGMRVGWGKIRPEKPDPYFRIKAKNVHVAAWNIDAASADFGDIDGDGKPDLAVVVPDGEGSMVKLYLNKGGSFPDEPDQQIRVPSVSGPSKIRLAHLNDDRIADIMIGGRSTALLLSQGNRPEYKVVPLSIAEVHQVRTGDVAGDGSKAILLGMRFGGYHQVRFDREGKATLVQMKPEVRGPYADLRFVDLNGDGRTDLVTSSGQVYLRQSDGKLPVVPTLELPLPIPGAWTYLAVSDFNGDRRPDIALLSQGEGTGSRLSVFNNTGNAERPFGNRPGTSIDLSGPDPKQGHPLLRDAPIVADWNGDGVPDLVVGKGQDNRVLVLFGGREGLDRKRSTTIELEYRIHYETGLHVADFDGDGVPDLASLGYTSTGVGASGPLAAYLWKQPVKSPR
jgi:glyoxylase-like metal-dependent hydrolase (beta-lactamase superfamily II)